MDISPVVPQETHAPNRSKDAKDTANRSRPSPLLPDSLKQPFVLFWVAILPQIVLLFLNIRNYQLVVGEMAPWQRSMCAKIGGSELLLVFGTIALVTLLRIRRQILPWALCWPLLILPVLYLWFATFQIGGQLLPQSVTVWILPPENTLYVQFAFMMPLIFYAAVRLSCAEISVSRVVEIAVTLGALIGIPLLFLVMIRLPGWEFFRFIPAIAIIIIIVVATLIVIAGATRLFVTSYVAVRKKGPLALGILAGIVGIVGPISGLLLNRMIPFPADFQARSVYLMAVTNGVLLLLPNFRHPRIHRAIWLAQCALFPFTFYFFLVFLPFLPLSIPAMIYIGAGFLVLTPTALFLIHGQRILDGYRNELRDGGRLIPALLAALAISIIPATYTIGAILDRVVLRHAIDYVYTPDYRVDTQFSGNPALVRRSVQHLRDFKAGLNLPFLSGFYNWIVFDGLVLPDDKMNHLHRAFFGSELERSNSAAFGIFGARSRRTRSIRETTSASVPHDVQLMALATTINSEGVCDRATVSLQMKNASLSQSEFVTQIHLPEGVLVSGFWLHIGKERVPGQLFEKKSALWVYQMIRDRTRRDPGLLLYTDRQTLELRVFPFAAGEERKVEIEFLYPASLKPSIRVGDETLRPSGESNAARVTVIQVDEDASAALFSPAALIELPHLARTPYLHFIIDRSVNSEVTAQSAAAAIRAAQTQFPNVRECMITVANYESADLTSEPTVINSAFQPKIDALTRHGGFLAQRAMKRALLRYNDQFHHAQPYDRWLTRFPLFIVVRGEQTEELREPDLEPFGRFTPDIEGYYVTVHGTRLEPRNFVGEVATDSYTARPVSLLKLGDSVAPIPFDLDTPMLINFTSKSSNGLGAFDPATHSFVPLAQTEIVAPNTRYAGGIAAWLDYFALIYNPSRGNTGLMQSVKRSRESGVMIGSTSFIVVENSAQWKMLERKQNQKLRNSTALEIEPVPEPSTWCLIIFGSAFLFFWLRKRQVAGAKLH